MTNTQNWPDRVYLRREKEGSSSIDLIDHTNRNGGSEYISAEKVREIQLATIQAALNSAAWEACGKITTLIRKRIWDINPESIIEQVKI
jgi:acetolactate synthase small subunit